MPRFSPCRLIGFVAVAITLTCFACDARAGSMTFTNSSPITLPSTVGGGGDR